MHGIEKRGDFDPGWDSGEVLLISLRGGIGGEGNAGRWYGMAEGFEQGCVGRDVGDLDATCATVFEEPREQQKNAGRLIIIIIIIFISSRLISFLGK